MIKYKGDMNIIPKENVMGGTGAYTYTEMLSLEECPKTRIFGCNTLNPGVSIGRHAHTGEGEAYIILDGEAVVEEDGVEYVLHPGDVEYCSDGHTHAIANRSDKPMSFLAIIML